MRVLVFQRRFAPLVADGRKRCTIRKRARCEPGDELSLREWTGKPYRSKQRELRCRAICKSVKPISISLDSEDALEIEVAGEYWHDADEIAPADGFDDSTDMLSWFRSNHELPFTGELITW